MVGNDGAGLGCRHIVVAHEDLVGAEPQPVARTQWLWPEPADGLYFVIQEQAVGARVLDDEAAVAEADAGMVGGDVAHPVRQHPAGVAGPADRTAVLFE